MSDWDDDLEEPDEGDMDDGETDDGESADLHRCPRCGKEVYEDAEICPYCGGPIAEGDSPGRKPLWFLIAGAVILVAIVLRYTLGHRWP